MNARSADVARFTLDGSVALEAHLAVVCDRVARGVRGVVGADRLDGVLLAGGYGRGEGGVLREAGVDRPYNDLEFYVFVRGNAVLAERRYGRALKQLAGRLSPVAGLEVEFKVLTLETLRRSGPSMFYYDLFNGHRWLIGDDALLDGGEHHRDGAGIPLHEAVRLLFNRCSGLLFSAERLKRPVFGPEEADFVGRNLAKAQLALGDVVLAAAGQYHWSCLERRERLRRLDGFDGTLPRAALCSHHAEGVKFKLHPHRSTASRETLLRRHAELSGLARELWFHVERRRLASHFVGPREYALSPVDKCPETPAFRNRLVNARTFGPLAAVRPEGSRYPRQRLFHALVLLLWEERLIDDPPLLRTVQRELNTPAADFAGLVSAYERLWHRFN